MNGTKLEGFYSIRDGKYVHRPTNAMYDNLVIDGKTYNFYGLSNTHNVHTDGTKLYSLDFHYGTTPRMTELTDAIEIASIHKRLIKPVYKS